MLTNCADSTRLPDERRIVEIASILAIAVLRLRQRVSVPTQRLLRFLSIFHLIALSVSDRSFSLLSMAAKGITGSHCNGYNFFNLNRGRNR
jgi:hypothetical protein